MAQIRYFRADDGSVTLPVDLTGSASSSFEIEVSADFDLHQYRVTFSANDDFSTNDTPTGGTVKFEYSQFQVAGRWSNPIDGEFPANQVNATDRTIAESIGMARKARITLTNITGTTAYARAFVVSS